MNKITIDFDQIKNAEMLWGFLNEKLQLDDVIQGWGRNLDAFWDVYSHWDSEDLFEVINLNKIAKNDFKEYVQKFLKLLEDLKKTNPNFNYKIVD